MFHSFNVVMINVYVIQAYISNIREGDHKPYTIFLLCGMFFPVLYEAVQLKKEGFKYFGSGWNLVDQSCIIISIVNWIFQYFYGQRHLQS